MGLFRKKKKDADFAYAEHYSEKYALNEEGIMPVGQNSDSSFSPYALTPDEIKGDTKETEFIIPMESASETLYKRMMETHTALTPEKSEEALPAESLLTKCSAFVNEDGKDNISPILNQPAYRLDSVDDIIADAEKRAQERVKRIYNKPSDTAVKIPNERRSVNNSDEGKIEISPVNISSETNKVKIPAVPVNPAPIVTPPVKNTENLIKTPVRHSSVSDDIDISAIKREEPIKNYQYRFADDNTESISEADESTAVFDAIKPEKSTDNKFNNGDDKTVSFDAVKINDNDSDTVTFDSITPEPFTAGLDKKLFKDIHADGEDDIYDDDSEFFDDYSTPENASAIKKELKSKTARLSLRFILTLVPSIILLLCVTPAVKYLPEQIASSLTIIQTAIFAFITVVNFRMFGSFKDVLKSKGSRWISAAAASLTSIIFGAYCILASTEAKQFFVVPAFCILFLLSGEIKETRRILLGFNFIVNDNDKNAVLLVDETKGSSVMAQNSVDGSALVTVGKPTAAIKGYLKNAYSQTSFSRAGTILSLMGFIVSLGMFAYGYMAGTASTDELTNGFMLFCAFSSIVATFGFDITELYPLRMASKRLREYDAVLFGHDSVEKLEPANAVVLKTSDIFPRGTVKLYNMRILSPTSIDNVIFEAAAVASAAGSPLGHVFRRIARTSKDYELPSTDSVKYENRLGISGWSNEHSILIGNRSLMEAHGVTVPPLEVDRKILRNGYFPVYVASDGKPCALLVIGYEIDADINYELHRLCAEGVTVLLDNCDSNITEEMLSDYFSVPQDYLCILNPAGSKLYKDITVKSEEESSAAAFSEGACALFSVITASIKIKKISVITYILGVILTVLGVVGGVTLAVFGLIKYLTPLSIIAFMLISRIIMSLPTIFERP